MQRVGSVTANTYLVVDHLSSALLRGRVNFLFNKGGPSIIPFISPAYWGRSNVVRLHRDPGDSGHKAEEKVFFAPCGPGNSAITV